MRRYLLSNLIFFLFLSTNPVYVLSEELSSREIKKEIVIYNLINGLYLDTTQMEFILIRAKQLKEYQDKMKKILDGKEEEEKQLLLVLKEKIKNDSISEYPELIKSFHKKKAEVMRIRKEYVSFLKRKVKEIKEILDKNQIYLLDNFTPCVVPPKGEARIGQFSLEGETRLLEKIRLIPSLEYENKKEKIAEKIIEKYYLLHPWMLWRENNGALKNKIIEIMDEVRTLNKVEFDLTKKDIAKRIKQLLFGNRTKKELDVDKKIVSYLLDPLVIPILEEKLRGKYLCAKN